ncbi:hypothetical protein CDD83_7181 [Cordyceps sp. RAO-2017]|nr:hypothetical protein CDD83_7181 [Cordyceps sp. RAO-2017]
MLLKSSESIAVGAACLATLWVVRLLLDRVKMSRLRLPPFVHLSEDEIRFTPVKSMTRALREHGPVVAIPHNGKVRRVPQRARSVWLLTADLAVQIEYITSAEHTRRVLTDESSFTFVDGMAEVLGLQWIRYFHGGTYFHDVDSAIRDFSTRRLDRITPKTWPIFELGALEFAKAARPGEPIDVLPYAQASMARAMVNIFLGQAYDNDDYVRRAELLSKDIAHLMGILGNGSFLARRFPAVWRAVTWVRIVLYRIPVDLGVAFARSLWTDICACEGASHEDKEENIVSFLVRRQAPDDGRLSLGAKLWTMVLVLTVLFASVHQTAVITVWVTYWLALRPHCQQSLLDEVSALRGRRDAAPLDHEALQRAERTDSFLREVLRMKGDSVNAVRAAVANVELGGYVIPKGSLVFPVTYLSFRSRDFYPDPDAFDATRWVGSGKSAATTGQDYLAFGLGRWSCPGRYLAVTEIKCWMLALVQCSRFELEGAAYQVDDPYNITAVPPRGRLLVERLSRRDGPPPDAAADGLTKRGVAA